MVPLVDRRILAWLLPVVVACLRERGVPRNRLFDTNDAGRASPAIFTNQNR